MYITQRSVCFVFVYIQYSTVRPKQYDPSSSIVYTQHPRLKLAGL